MATLFATVKVNENGSIKEYRRSIIPVVENPEKNQELLDQIKQQYPQGQVLSIDFVRTEITEREGVEPPPLRR